VKGRGRGEVIKNDEVKNLVQSINQFEGKSRSARKPKKKEKAKIVKASEEKKGFFFDSLVSHMAFPVKWMNGVETCRAQEERQEISKSKEWC